MNNDNIFSWNLKDLICIPYKNVKILLFTKIARKISEKFKSSQITMSNLYYFEVEKYISNIKAFSSIDKANSHLIEIKHVIVIIIIYPMYFFGYCYSTFIHRSTSMYRIAYVLNIMHHFLQNCCKKLKCLHVEKNQTTFLNVNILLFFVQFT